MPAGSDNARLDIALAPLLPGHSRASIQRLIRQGSVEVDGEPASRPSTRVAVDQHLRVELKTRSPDAGLTGELIPLQVLYEDNAIAVIDKPAGMVVHPGAGHATGTLVHAILHRFAGQLSAVTEPARPGIVHRLDKGTSGVIVVALTDEAHHKLAGQFAARTVEKTYLAIVHGHPGGARASSGTIDVALGRDRNDRTKISSRANRLHEAVTRWRRVEDFRSMSLLELSPKTGRTHQIRAHLAHIQHACVCDPLYAGKQWKGIEDTRVRQAVATLGRPALHALRLRIAHPTTGEPLEFEAELAADLRSLLDLLRGASDVT